MTLERRLSTLFSHPPFERLLAGDVDAIVIRARHNALPWWVNAVCEAPLPLRLRRFIGNAWREGERAAGHYRQTQVSFHASRVAHGSGSSSAAGAAATRAKQASRPGEPGCVAFEGAFPTVNQRTAAQLLRLARGIAQSQKGYRVDVVVQGRAFTVSDLPAASDQTVVTVTPAF